MKVENLRAGQPTPQDEAVRIVPSSAPSVQFLEDAEGRRLQLRDLTILEESDVIIAAGRHADNIRTLNRALMVARVAAITMKGDDVPTAIPVPRTEEQYANMMTLVGRAGINAVAEHLAPPANENGTDGELEKAKN